MSILNDAENVVADKFGNKRPEIVQEFCVRVVVHPGDTDPATVRGLLDNYQKHLSDYLYADGTGSLQVIHVEPK